MNIEDVNLYRKEILQEAYLTLMEMEREENQDNIGSVNDLYISHARFRMGNVLRKLYGVGNIGENKYVSENHL